MEITQEILYSILDAYPYEIVFVDRDHIIRYINKTAKQRYGNHIQVGQSIFQCHNKSSKEKIIEFLKRADNGENEMFESFNNKTGKRTFFTPVKDSLGKVIGYFERHEVAWDINDPATPVSQYWKNK